MKQATILGLIARVYVIFWIRDFVSVQQATFAIRISQQRFRSILGYSLACILL